MCTCFKAQLLNVSQNIITVTYMRCGDTMLIDEMWLYPNISRNVWYVSILYSPSESLQIIDPVCFPETSQRPTPSNTRTQTPTPSITRTQTPTPTYTPTITRTPRSTPTTTPTNTQTRTTTPTNTPTKTVTKTPRATSSPTQTPTQTTTNTRTPRASSSPTQTPTPTKTTTPTNTPTKTTTPTNTPTQTQTPTASPTQQITVTQTSTPTPTPTQTQTKTPTTTQTPTNTQTPTTTQTPTNTPTNTQTPTVTPTQTEVKYYVYIFPEPNNSADQGALSNFADGAGAQNWGTYFNNSVPDNNGGTYSNDLGIYARQPSWSGGGNFANPAGLRGEINPSTKLFASIEITGVNANLYYFYSVWIPLAGVGNTLSEYQIDVGTTSGGSQIFDNIPSTPILPQTSLTVTVTSGSIIPAGDYRILWISPQLQLPSSIPLSGTLYFTGVAYQP